MSGIINQSLSAAVVVLIGLVFAQAFIHKLRAPAQFKQSLLDYDLLPEPLVVPIALTLLLSELAVIASLLWTLLPTGSAQPFPMLLGLGGGGALLTLYALAMGWNLARREFDLDCGCASQATPISFGLVLRNLLLVLLAWSTMTLGDATAQGMYLGLPTGLVLLLGYSTLTQILSHRVRKLGIGVADG